MINSTNLINNINQIVKINYPLYANLYDDNSNIILSKLFELSHFSIRNIYYNLYFPFEFNIQGSL
jgi:hypothetical protein